MNRTVPLRSNPDKPLSRNTPLGRNTASRGGKFPAAGRRTSGTATGLRLPPGEFTPAVKRLVRKRAGGGDSHAAVCEGCLRWLGPAGGEYQHRRSRGAGGCRDEVIQSAANCLLLCRLCHMEAEERRRDLSQDGAGFWIGHGTGLDYDPRFVGAMLGALGSSGTTVWLSVDGEYLDRPPLEAVA